MDGDYLVYCRGIEIYGYKSVYQHERNLITKLKSVTEHVILFGAIGAPSQTTAQMKIREKFSKIAKFYCPSVYFLVIYNENFQVPSFAERFYR